MTNKHLEARFSELTRLYGAAHAFLEEPSPEGWENLIDAVKNATPEGMEFQPKHIKIMLVDLASCNCDDPMEDMDGDTCLHCYRIIR
jgi:hypothetical protein